MIDGVVLTPLKQIVDERGKVMHMLKATDPIFKQFGEIYFSCAWPGAIKGWHVHKTMTLNLAVLAGYAVFACYDMREESKTKGVVEKYHLSLDNYCLLTIPPGVASGYAPYGGNAVMIANCASEPHDKKEIEYFWYNVLPGTYTEFEWLIRNG